jgi:hypothetical protein
LKRAIASARASPSGMSTSFALAMVCVCEWVAPTSQKIVWTLEQKSY